MAAHAPSRDGAYPLDMWLLLAVMCLLSLGLVMIASTSISTAARNTGVPLHYFWRQLIFLGVALALAVASAAVPLALWKKSASALCAIGLFLLVMVLIPGVGHEVNGSARWLRLGPVNLQPSEPMKLWLIVYFAAFLSADGTPQSQQVKLTKPLLVLGLISVLLLLEPDYGATVVLFATALAMLFLAGVSLLRFFVWGAIAVAAFAVILLAAPYRLERVMSFLNPWADPFGSGFQLTQALIAFGRGEWFGVGLGASVQKLFYLPEAHTDFLFAVLAEEIGFAGGALVIALFTFLVVRAVRIGRAAEHKARYFAAYLAYGLGLLVGLQAFVNIGVNMGVLPTKGLSLPLMSYGGSSLVVNCIAIALLLRIDFETRRLP